MSGVIRAVTPAPPTPPPPSSLPPPPSPPPTIFSPPPSSSPRPCCRPCKGRKWALDATSCQCHCTIRPESCSQKGRRLNPHRCRCEAMRT
ncbi:vascular endothelial growth factor B [Lates japonicus]